jgi:hypothetical protein
MRTVGLHAYKNMVNRKPEVTLKDLGEKRNRSKGPKFDLTNYDKYFTVYMA